MQLECSICNVRNVLLNNLPGRYTTLLIDGVPIFSSVSSACGYALSYASDRLALTASCNLNRIKNFAIPDPGATAPVTGDPVTLLSSASAPVTVQGTDLNLSYQITPALTVSAAGELVNYQLPAGTLVFARPKAKAHLGLGYERGDLDVSAKWVWTGPMNLRQFHDDGSANQNRFKLDDTPKRDSSPGFATLDLRAEYAVSQGWPVYAGADNMFDAQQARKESFLFVDGDGAPDVVHLWGPNRGRCLYAGVKLAF